MSILEVVLLVVLVVSLAANVWLWLDNRDFKAELEDTCETLDRSRAGCRERIERLEESERWTPEG